MLEKKYEYKKFNIKMNTSVKIGYWGRKKNPNEIIEYQSPNQYITRKGIKALR